MSHDVFLLVTNLFLQLTPIHVFFQATSVFELIQPLQYPRQTGELQEFTSALIILAVYLGATLTPLSSILYPFLVLLLPGSSCGQTSPTTLGRHQAVASIHSSWLGHFTLIYLSKTQNIGYVGPETPAPGPRASYTTGGEGSDRIPCSEAWET